MLDLSGFESLARNGLEQLCINAANERLQALCDACLIDREQQVRCRACIGRKQAVFVLAGSALAVFDLN